MRRIAIAAALAAALAASATAGSAQDARLEPLRSRIAAGEIPGVHAVIVVQDGRTLAEWYFPGEDEQRGWPQGRVTFDAGTLHDVRSISKSVVGLLFGIALAEGRIRGLDEPVLSFFPEYQDLRTPERTRIRLRDVLSMTSGFAWDENTFPYADRRNSETAMDMAPDRLRYVLSQAITAPPGERWTYSGGDVALIGAIIARATGMPLDRYAEQKLFRPLGIEGAVWLRDDRGVPFAASGLRLRPRDTARIGQMMLDGGRFEGRQIVPADWVGASTTRHAAIAPGPCTPGYGYFWWLGPDCGPDGRPREAWFAGFGYGGQRLWIVPSRRLVLVTNMGLYRDPRQREHADGIFRDVLAATAAASPAP